MPLLLQRVIRCMDQIAPLSLAETSWDNVGLLLEAPTPRNGKKVLLTIDLTQQVLEEAIQDPSIGVIVAYHPFLFKPIKRLTLQEDKQNIALKCAVHGISVYSPHTALDNCVGGINDWLARGLGKGKTIAINPTNNPPSQQEGAGSGRLHVLEQPISFQELCSRVKSYLNLSYLRISGKPRQISSIAICAGSGFSVLSGVNADAYLTGEMSHHEVLATVAQGTNVILCEHSNSERGYLHNILRPRLLSALRVDHGLDVECDDSIDVICSSVDKDPLGLYQ